MPYTPMRHVTRHTYTPENGQRGLQFVWYEGAQVISVHRPAGYPTGGWEETAFTTFDEPVDAAALPAVCDDWADGYHTIKAIRAIVTACQYGTVNGCTVDLFTASAIIAVYDKLSPTAQRRMAAMPIPTMAAIALRLVK